MDTKTTNLVNMIRTTLGYCTNNASATSGVLAFANAKTTAQNKLVLIDSLNQIANGDSKGVTLDTNAIRKVMTDQSVKCGSAVSAYAASVNNNTLRQKVTYTENALNRLSKENVDDVCQTIQFEANSNIAVAGDFGYAAMDVTDLQTSIDLYRLSLQNPRQAIISKKQAITNIKALARQTIDDIFKKIMDKMVITLKASKKDFHDGYFLAREIINLGTTSAKIRGTVKDLGDVPLVGVNFQIRKTGTGELVTQTNSVAKGTFRIANILPGDYDLSWTFKNYFPITQANVHISAGKELQRKLTMLPAVTTNYDISAGQILVLDNDVRPTPKSSALIKNTSPAGVTIHAYFAAANNTPFSGTGVTLLPGEEKTITLADLGPVMAFILAQNPSALNGSFQVTAISGGV